MAAIKRIIKNFLSVLLALCFVLTVTSCASNKPTPAAPPETENSAALPVSEASAAAEAEEEMITIEQYALRVSVPEEFDIASYGSRNPPTYVNLWENEIGESVSWLGILPKEPTTEDASAASVIAMDASGAPVLTEQSVADLFDWEVEIRAVLGEGTLTVAGQPAAFIVVELTGEPWQDTVWRARLTRIIHKDISYNFLYASAQDWFDKNLPITDSIIASARFATGDEAEEAAFWDISMTYLESGVTATVSDDEVYLFNNGYEGFNGNALRFYAKHDDTVLYTDTLLNDTKQLNRLFRIWTYDLVDQRFRQFHNPKEILREETEVNGKRALRAVYHDEWEHNQFPEYMEILLFVHNYDLYVLQSKGEIGREDILHSFTQPVIDSVSFDKAVTEPPKERPMPYSDTVKWMNDTYAILTVRNNSDTDLVGGFLPTEANVQGMRDGLYQNWGITDRATSDEIIKSLYENGHRAQFRAFATESGIFGLSQNEFDAIMKDATDELQALRYIYENTREAYNLHGDKAILAWDYCRIIYLYCSGYIAGYYTYSEALDLSLPIALELQGIYSSWDEMYRDYMAGFHFWSPGDAKDPSTENYSRTQIMLELEAKQDGSALLPWNTKLVADWHAAS